MKPDKPTLGRLLRGLHMRNADTAIRVNTKNHDCCFFCLELRRKRMIPLVTR